MNERIEINTTDLLLRDFVREDWPAIHEYASDPEVVRYDLWGPNSEEQTREFVDSTIRARQTRPRTSFDLAVTLRQTGQLIGGGSIRIRDQPRRVGDIGYVLHKAHWGRGLGTQVARGLVGFGFETLRLYRIWATCHVENIGSANVLTRAGMRQEGLLRGHHYKDGVGEDSKLFAVLASDVR